MAAAAPDRVLNAVVIGAGMVAATHVAALRDAAGVRLHGVWSRTAARAEALAKPEGAKVYASLDAVAADAEVDFVIVLTPPNARVALVETLVAAGKPILMEKPVARDGTEARALVETCEKAGVPLGIVFQHRMREASLAATNLVASGALGALGLVEIAVPWWRGQSYYDEPGRGTYARDGGGVLISQAIHTIDLALSLTGAVASVQAMTATTRFHEMEAEDLAVAGLRFENGSVGSLTATTASFPGGAEWIRLHYDRASLHLEAGVLTVSHRDGRVETHGAKGGTGGGADPMAFTHAWHQGIIEDFAEALRQGRDPVVTGRAALAAHALIDAITQSARSGQVTEVTA